MNMFASVSEDVGWGQEEGDVKTRDAKPQRERTTMGPHLALQGTTWGEKQRPGVRRPEVQLNQSAPWTLLSLSCLRVLICRKENDACPPFFPGFLEAFSGSLPLYGIAS